MNRRIFPFLSAVLVLFSFLFGLQIGKLQNNATGNLKPEISNVSNETEPEFSEKIEGSLSGDSSGSADSTNSSKDELEKKTDLRVFRDVWKRLEEKYVDASAILPKEMVYGAIRGMVSALDDPYTVYMTPEETVEFQNSLDGTLEGIGAELTVKDKLLTIVSVIKNSPADKAGLKPDDAILEIDDEISAEMTIYNAITKIRGKRGTKVKLLIFRRDDGTDPFEVEIRRDKISLDSVTTEEKGDGIFYIGVHQFTDRTGEEFKNVVKDLLFKDPKGVILDLRGNGGGYLDIAVDMLSEFIGKKKVAVKIQRRNERDNSEVFLGESPSLKDVPLVVLVNRASASASEIVAGAAQDYKRGIVMGEVTFGKGSVQEVETLPDKSSLRVTIAKWLTPNGRSIDKVGITPDIVIETTEEDMKKGRDLQVEKAMEYLRKF